MKEFDNNRGKVLIVDDTISIINMIKTALESEGYQILVATSGVKGIKSAKLANPDLILLDILMPDMDGYETCKRLKEDDETKDIPVLFMSALIDVFEKVKAFKVGAVDYVTKPLNVEELQARVGTQVSLSKMQKKLKDTNKWFEEKVEERTNQLKKHYEELQTAEEEIKATNVELKVNVNQLFESKERYRNFIKLSHEGIHRWEFTEPMPLNLPMDQKVSWITEKQYLAECNDAFAIMYGFENAEEIIGKKLADLEEMEETALGINRQLIKNDYNWTNFETEETTKFGVKKFFLNNLVGIIEGDKLIRLWGTQVDITSRKQAEIEIEESKRLYKSLVDSLPFNIYRVDVEGKVTFANTFFTENMVSTAKDIIGKTAYNLHPKEFAEKYDYEDQIVINEARTLRLTEKNYNQKLGKTTYVEVVKIPVFDSEGNVEGIQGVYWDITTRKEAEEAIIEERNRAANILQATHAGTWDWNLQTNEVSIDERWANIIGYSLEELTPIDIDFWRDNLHPDDTIKTQKVLQKHMDGELEYYEAEFRQKHKDDSWVWVYGRGKVIEWTSDGKPLRMYGTHLDISERKITEIALIESEERFKTFMNNSPFFAYIKDENQEHVYSNNLVLESGLEPKGIFQPEVNKIIDQADREVLEKKTPYVELEYRAKFGGENRWLRDIKFPIELPDNKIFVGGVAIDITENKEHEKELEKHRNHLELLVKERTDELEVSNEELYSQKVALENLIEELNRTQAKLVQSEKMASLGVIVAGVAHEINNPVNFINSSLTGLKNNLKYLYGYGELYNQLSENTEKALESLRQKEKEASFIDVLEMFNRSVEIIEVGIERTIKIVKGLKAFARSDEKKLETYDIHESIDNTLLILYNQFKNRIKITKEFGQIPEIECFPSQVNQVIMNILNNAVQAIEHKGEIKISTSLTEDDQVAIEIKDSGKGIQQEQLNHIFDPFFTTKDVGKGTGLGLSISYGIVKDHKGEIIVESELNKGTNFKIIFPVKQ